MTQEAAVYNEDTPPSLTPQGIGHIVVGTSAPSHEALVSSGFPGVIADMDNIKHTYYHNLDVTGAERQAANGWYEAAIPSTATLYHALNISELPGIDIEASKAFRKEDVLEVSIDKYRISVDHDGSEWLLKAGGYQKDSKTPKLEALTTIERMQKEVFAARIGHIIGYPLAETRIVQQDDQPWLAVRFMPDVRDHWMAGADDGFPHPYRGIKPQPEHLLTRPIYNALINATSDSAQQGLIDQKTGEYYAMDTRTSLPEGACIESDNAVARQMMESMRMGEFGPFKMSEYVQTLGGSIRHSLEEGSFRSVFKDYVGSPNQPGEVADHLEQRARALLSILDGPDAAEFTYEPDFVLANTGS